MTRISNSANQTAAEQRHVVARILVDLDFSSGHARFHDGLGSLDFLGNTYSGVGELGEIEQIGESTDLRPPAPIKLTLAGVDPSLIAHVQNEEYYGRSAAIYVAFFDKDTFQLITSVEPQVYEGLMDTMTIKRQADQAVIELTIESHLAGWQDSLGLLWTDEWMQSIYPGDLGCNLVTTLVGKVLKWMNKGTTWSPPLTFPGRPGRNQL